MPNQTSSSNKARFAWRTYHYVNAEFVPWELCHQLLLLDVPNPHRGKMAALSSDEITPVFGEGQRCDGLSRDVGEMTLAVLAGIVQDNRASRINSKDL